MRRRVVARAAKAVDALERGTARQRRRAAAGRLLRRPRDLPRLLHRAAGAGRDPAHLRHHAVVRPAPRRPAGRDPRRLRRAAACATVPVFLMRDPVERIWSMVRMNQQRRPEDFPGPTDGLGGPALRPRRPRAAHPLRPHPGGDGRGVRTGRAVAGVLRAALRPRRPRRPVCPPRHRPARPRPRPRRQRLPEGRRPAGRPGGARWPHFGRLRAAARFPDVDLAAVWLSPATSTRRDRRRRVARATPDRLGTRRAQRLRCPSRAGGRPRPRPRSAGRSPRAAGPRRAGTSGR